MTGPKTPGLLLAGSLLLAPTLALAQDTSPADQAMMGGFFLFQGVAMALLVVVIGMALYFASQREKRKQDLIARFVDKGQEIPPALLPPTPSRQRELGRGIWFASLGLGIGLVLYIATDDWRVAAWCLILLFLAAASFLNALLFYPSRGSGSAGRDGD